MEECHTWDKGSVWHKDWPPKTYIGQWPIFRSQAVLLNILKTFWWMNVILCIMDQCDTKIDLIKYMQVSYLLPIVHGSVILPYIFKVSVADLNYFEVLRDGASQGYLCPSGHLLWFSHLQLKEWNKGHSLRGTKSEHLMDECHTLCNGPMWHNDWPHVYRSVTYSSWSSDFAIYLKVSVADLNCFAVLRDNAGWGYLCPSGHLL